MNGSIIMGLPLPVESAVYLYMYGIMESIAAILQHRCVMQEELDRFCETLIAIRREIQEIEDGKVDK